jgi:hypothetical protein
MQQVPRQKKTMIMKWCLEIDSGTNYEQPV